MFFVVDDLRVLTSVHPETLGGHKRVSGRKLTNEVASENASIRVGPCGSVAGRGVCDMGL
jgi:hypothetical protein